MSFIWTWRCCAPAWDDVIPMQRYPELFTICNLGKAWTQVNTELKLVTSFHQLAFHKLHPPLKVRAPKFSSRKKDIHSVCCNLKSNFWGLSNNASNCLCYSDLLRVSSSQCSRFTIVIFWHDLFFWQSFWLLYLILVSCCQSWTLKP